MVHATNNSNLNPAQQTGFRFNNYWNSTPETQKLAVILKHNKWKYKVNFLGSQDGTVSVIEIFAVKKDFRTQRGL